jgi:hypothetical protein
MTDSRIEWYEQRKSKALETIRMIEVDGWTFHEAHGNELMHDVTAQRLADKKSEVSMMDKFIALARREA